MNILVCITFLFRNCRMLHSIQSLSLLQLHFIPYITFINTFLVNFLHYIMRIFRCGFFWNYTIEKFLHRRLAIIILSLLGIYFLSPKLFQAGHQYDPLMKLTNTADFKIKTQYPRRLVFLDLHFMLICCHPSLCLV